jgi:hypothetical protein
MFLLQYIISKVYFIGTDTLGPYFGSENSSQNYGLEQVIGNVHCRLYILAAS